GARGGAASRRHPLARPSGDTTRQRRFRPRRLHAGGGADARPRGGPRTPASASASSLPLLPGRRGRRGGRSVSRDPDVVVVGAGPAGSAVAARLATLGWRVVVLDRGEFPRRKPC